MVEGGSLETVVPQGTVGSNPTSSARQVTGQAICPACFRLGAKTTERGNAKSHQAYIATSRKRIRGHWRGSIPETEPLVFTARSMASAALGATARHILQAKSTAISTPALKAAIPIRTGITDLPFSNIVSRGPARLKPQRLEPWLRPFSKGPIRVERKVEVESTLTSYRVAALLRTSAPIHYLPAAAFSPTILPYTMHMRKKGP